MGFFTLNETTTLNFANHSQLKNSLKLFATKKSTKFVIYQ